MTAFLETVESWYSQCSINRRWYSIIIWVREARHAVSQDGSISATAPPADPSVQMTLVQLGVVQLGLVKWGWTQWTQYYGAFSKTAVTEKFRYQGKTGGAFSSGVEQKREQLMFHFGKNA